MCWQGLPVKCWIECLVPDFKRNNFNILSLSTIFVQGVLLNNLYQVKEVSICFRLLSVILNGYWILSHFFFFVCSSRDDFFSFKLLMCWIIISDVTWPHLYIFHFYSTCGLCSNQLCAVSPDSMHLGCTSYILPSGPRTSVMPVFRKPWVPAWRLCIDWKWERVNAPQGNSSHSKNMFIFCAWNG